MARPFEYDTALAKKVLALHQTGSSYRNIARMLEITHCKVQRIVARFKDNPPNDQQ